jgi:hypothetical protein
VFFRIEAAGLRLLARSTFVVCALLIGSAAAFTPHFSQDPLERATATIRSNWDAQFACGPAYIIGAYEVGAASQAPAAYGIGMWFGRSVIGLSPGDYRYAPWVDQNRQRDLGAVLVETPFSDRNSTFLAEFSSATPATTITLPYRRTSSSEKFVLSYRFVPPLRCPAK